MKRLHVTDHALVRFLERVGGLDVEFVRSAIENSLVRAATAAESIGGGEYKVITAEFEAVVVDGVVVTVLPTSVKSGVGNGGQKKLDHAHHKDG